MAARVSGEVSRLVQSPVDSTVSAEVAHKRTNSRAPEVSAKRHRNDDLTALDQMFGTMRAASSQRAARLSVACSVDPEPLRWLVQMGAGQQSQGSETIETGMETVRRLRWALEHTKFKFEDPQVEFHRMCLSSLLPVIFKRHWVRYRKQIMAMLGVESVTQRVAFSMPRGQGKTIATAAMIAALCYASASMGAKLLIACFAVHEKQTRWMLQRAVEMLENVRNADGAERVFVHISAAAFKVTQTPSHMDLNAVTFLAMPGTSSSGRGLQPDLIVLDEAAYIDPKCMWDTILPMMSNLNRTVFAISSPSEECVAFDAFFRRKFSDGRPLFENAKVENVCADCAQKGVMECPHIIPVIPPWKGKEQMEFLKIMYAGNAARYAHEVAGTMGTTQKSVFHEGMVDAMFTRRVTGSAAASFLFLSVDPAAGGETSDTAWTTLFVDPNKNVVVSARARVTVVYHGGEWRGQHSRQRRCPVHAYVDARKEARCLDVRGTNRV